MLKYLAPILLFCSCNKMEELTPTPSEQAKSQVHIQSINATVYLVINGKDTVLYNNSKHIVQAFEVYTLKSVGIMKLYGEKVTASVKHNGASYNIGEVDNYKLYKF
jgi:hypothetical protein